MSEEPNEPTPPSAEPPPPPPPPPERPKEPGYETRDARGRQLPVDVHATMFRYSRAVCENVPTSKIGLTHASERIIECVQRELHAREGALNAPAATELYLAQAWALYALRVLKEDKAAKETQVRLSNGRPLAICVGGLAHRDVEIHGLGTFKIYDRGCFRTFEEPTRPSGRMWARRCPTCRNNRKRNPLRDAERAFRRRIRELERLGYVG